MLLAIEFCPIGIKLKKSRNSPPGPGRGLFAAQPVGMGSIVGYCDGSSVQKDFRYSGSLCTTYGDSVMKVTREISEE